MKLRYLPAGLALVTAMALFSLACDSEETSSDYTDDADTTATGSGAESGGETADADEGDNGPIAPQMFESTKQLMSDQVESMAAQVETLSKVAAEYKDEQLDGLVKEASEKIAACRAKVAEVTQANSGTTIRKELPALMEEAGKVIEKAMLRMQEVGKAKMSGGG